jgi:hypothetical protein
MEQKFVLLAPPDGPFPPGAPVRREQLAGQRLIVGQQGTGMRQYVDDLRAAGVEWTLAVQSEHRIALVPLVLGGVGLAVVVAGGVLFLAARRRRVVLVTPGDEKSTS